MNPNDITSYIYKQFPIAEHLGAEVELYDGNKIIISAPLKPNKNHTSTAFGGSVNALAILSGWTLLYLKLEEFGIKSSLVIQKSSFEFKKPIDTNFKAICTMPDEKIWDKFIVTLKKRNIARISMHTNIEYGLGVAGLHKGVYVASIS
jgi:thioesterase domain-containing protein